MKMCEDFGTDTHIYIWVQSARYVILVSSCVCSLLGSPVSMICPQALLGACIIPPPPGLSSSSGSGSPPGPSSSSDSGFPPGPSSSSDSGIPSRPFIFLWQWHSLQTLHLPLTVASPPGPSSSSGIPSRPFIFL